MSVRQFYYTNSDLWKKSEELISKTDSLQALPEERNHLPILQLGKIVLSIRDDIRDAYSENDLRVVLYHFSKAKSSCLVIEEMLTNISEMFSMEFSLECMKTLDEMKSILGKYIHLSRINMIIEKKRFGPC